MIDRTSSFGVVNDTVSDPSVAPSPAATDPPDLDAIEADFDRVERALQELADGTYAAPASDGESDQPVPHDRPTDAAS